MTESFSHLALSAVLLVAGCSSPPPATAPVTTSAAPSRAAATPPPPPATSSPAPAAPPSTAATSSPVSPPQAVAAQPAKPSAPPSSPPPKVSAAAPKATPPATAAASPAPAVARPSAPKLDLRSLEQRLKDSDAIGLMTKLSLKNQVDDLISRFRNFHQGQRPPTLTELRPAYELLLMKVLSLLQDKDMALANDINQSREAIWGVLADRDKLATYL
jgi:hypothetical protein